MTKAQDKAPTIDDIERLGRAALATVPAVLARHVRGVQIRVEEFPDPEIEQEMGLESPFELLGLYHGVSLESQSVSDLPRAPDMIFLYRRPLLDYWCESGESLGHLVRHVLIHEIGHHFGFSDADMEALEAEE